MPNVSFVDDNLILSECYVKRSYDGLKKMILEKKFECTDYIMEADEIFAFQVSKNHPLTQIYNMDCYVVKFIFSSISQLHDDGKEQILQKLIEKLNNYVKSHSGYYNLRIPSHIVDLLKAVNTVFSDTIFCGGTVEEVIHGKFVDNCNENNLDINFPDKELIIEHKQLLMGITLESFKSYQGQYHVSNVTQSKAGIIYENWIKESMESLENKNMVVACKDSIPVGFVTIKETDNAVEGILSAVDPKNRKLGAYRAMIAYLINYANENKKSFVTSTQFDNYIVQGVWNSLGLKPFYSIYNIHIDNR